MKVRLADGSIVEARVLENLGFQPSIGDYAKRVQLPDGRTCMVVGGRGHWREWGVRDKLGPVSR